MLELEMVTKVQSFYIGKRNSGIGSVTVKLRWFTLIKKHHCPAISQELAHFVC
jgi:hypothetical protein